MRKARFLVAWLLVFMVSGQAADVTVEKWAVEVTLSNGYGNLGVPRQQVLADDAGGVVIFRAGWSDRHFYYSDDLDAADTGWTDTIGARFPPTSWDDHAHMYLEPVSGAADTLYVCHDAGAGDSMMVKIIAVNHGTSLIDVTETYTAGFAALAYPVYRGAAWMVPGTDTLVLVTRGHDGTSEDVMDIMSFVSADRGRTWSDSVRIIDLSGVSGNTRIGAINMYDGTVSAVIYSSSRGRFYWFVFDRSAGAFSLLDSLTAHGSQYTSFSANAIEDTVAFLAAGRTNSQWVDYWFKRKGAGSWTRDSLEIGGSYAFSPSIHTSSNRAAERLTLFYAKFFYNAVDSQNLACQYWDWQTNTWAGETIVNDSSAGYINGEISPCLTVPAAHGDVAYITWIHDTGTDGPQMVARITYSDAKMPLRRRRSAVAGRR